jgi:hypothetical protein
MKGFQGTEVIERRLYVIRMCPWMWITLVMVVVCDSQSIFVALEDNADVESDRSIPRSAKAPICFRNLNSRIFWVL